MLEEGKMAIRKLGVKDSDDICGGATKSHIQLFFRCGNRSSTALASNGLVMTHGVKTMQSTNAIPTPEYRSNITFKFVCDFTPQLTSLEPLLWLNLYSHDWCAIRKHIQSQVLRFHRSFQGTPSLIPRQSFFSSLGSFDHLFLRQHQQPTSSKELRQKNGGRSSK